MKIKQLGFDSPVGGNMIYWAKNQVPVKNFIDRNKLAPVRLPDLDIHGGIRVWHLHLADQIYSLNEGQWSEFSKGIMSEVSRRLQNAPQISFEEGMLLSAVAQNIGER
jgi:hypothetical protein